MFTRKLKTISIIIAASLSLSACLDDGVVETVGMVDAVFFAGDLVDTPNRASEWFYRDDVSRPAFFPALQGNFNQMFPEHPYRGGEILQNAPITFTDGRTPIETTFPTADGTWDDIVSAANAGLIEQVRYKYPRQDDLWLGVEQELLDADVDLVVSGHSHVWSRTFAQSSSGEQRLNYIETSNVGNSFGPFAGPNNRVTWAREFYPDPATNDTRDNDFWAPEDYPRVGDPHSRPDVVPTEVVNGIDFMRDVDGADPGKPYLSSNTFTVFTIIDSVEGTVKSYAHDTNFPLAPAILVDCFALDSTAQNNPCNG